MEPVINGGLELRLFGNATEGRVILKKLWHVSSAATHAQKQSFAICILAVNLSAALIGGYEADV
jgi:hypothetical protein